MTIQILMNLTNTTMTMNKVKKIPMRKCVITQDRFPKKELIRIVKTPTGEVEIDETGRKNGRGAYLSNSKAVIELAQKKRTLDKVLEINIPDQIYEELLKLGK